MKPRPSVLAQFDPLLSESPVYTSSDSGEESDLDKENLAPEFNEPGMTAFFTGRTYKREYTQPTALTKRLIDIGDVTVTETFDEEEEGKDDDENGEKASFSVETPKPADTARHVPRSTPRTPLAEISLEPRQMPFSKKLVASPSQTRPPRSTSLTSLVESVNRAGKSFGNLRRAPLITADHLDMEKNSIMATNAPFSLQASTSSQQPEASGFSLLAPPPIQNTSNLKGSNRFSLDLHSSFNLQLQSETSFDLLNDRISLYDAQGNDLELFLNELDVRNEENSPQNAPSASPSNFQDSDDTTLTNGGETIPMDCHSPSSVASQFKELSLSPQSDSTSPLVFGTLIKQPNSKVTPALRRTITTTVPALRVIKRTKRYNHERHMSDSSGFSDSVDNIPQQKIPPPVTEISSEAPASNSASQTFTQAAESTRPPVTEPKGMKPHVHKPSAVSGPRRVLVSDATKFGKSGAIPSTTLGRPKIPLPTLGSMKSTAVVSGTLRPAGASGIPPPASKLPAPSGIARLSRKPGAAGGNEVPGNRMAPFRSAR